MSALPRIAVRHSVAWLVLETANSLYSLEVGRSYTKATCHKGTFSGDLDGANVGNLPTFVTRTWAVATGMDLAPEGARPAVATRAIQNVLADERFTIHSERALTTTPVQVARWVLTPGEILNPAQRTRMTAKVFVAYGAPDHQVPVTRNICCVCATAVDLFGEEFTLSRVNGDSRWGYEPMHQACK